MALELISRQQAKALGKLRYFTGRPCARGHISERQVANFSCLVCKNEKRKEFVIQNPEAVSAANARHYYANREAMIERAARSSKENPERNRANARQYYARHKDKYSTHSRNRKARARNADGHHTAKQIKEMFAKQGGKCANCKASLKGGQHVDHIMPLSRGGSNWISNIQLLCPPCNLTKKAKLPEEWARMNGRLV